MFRIMKTIKFICLYIKFECRFNEIKNIFINVVAALSGFTKQDIFIS